MDLESELAKLVNQKDLPFDGLLFRRYLSYQKIDQETLYTLVYLSYQIATNHLEDATFPKVITQVARGNYGVSSALERAVSYLAPNLTPADLASKISDYSTESILEFLRTFNPTTERTPEYEDERVYQLLRALLDIQPNDTVYHLGSGNGSFLGMAAQKQPKARYTGIDISFTANALSTMRASSLPAPYTTTDNDIFVLPAEPVANKAYLSYPWGIAANQLLKDNPDAAAYAEALPTITSPRNQHADWLYIRRLIGILAPGGTGVTLTASRALFGNLEKDSRQFIVNSGHLHAVIALPLTGRMRLNRYLGGLNILIVGETIKPSVRFVDATDLMINGEGIAQILLRLTTPNPHSVQKTPLELAVTDYDLQPATHLKEELVVPNSAPLSELTSSIMRGVTTITSSELEAMTTSEDTGIHYVHLKDLIDGLIERDLTNLTHLDPKQEGSILEDGDVIVTKSSLAFRAAVAEVEEGQKIITNGNLYVIRPDKEKLDPYYLVAFLESALGKEVIERSSAGSRLQVISIKALNELPIPVISLEQQREVGQRFREQLVKIREMRVQLRQERKQLAEIFPIRM